MLHNSFISELFDDREDDNAVDDWFEGLWDRIWNREPSVPDTVWEGEEDGVFLYHPTKEESGVEEDIFKLCCTISDQVYSKYSAKDFRLSTKEMKTEVLIYDDHGIFNATSPPFIVTLTGKTMILGWRGTHDYSDVLTDVCACPHASFAWKKHAKYIKVQSAMAAIVIDDFLENGDEIIKLAKQHEVTEIITTGHSLGGALAQIGHLTLRGLIEDKSSEWNELDGISIKSVGISAPMSIVLTKKPNRETEKFIDDLKDNSSNVVYKNDPIPRGYGFLSFIEEGIDDLSEDSSNAMLGGLFSKLLRVDKKVDDMIAKVKDGEKTKGLLKVFSRYIHLGNLIYYADENGKPRVLTDKGAFFKNTLGLKNTFRSVKYVNSGKNKISPDIIGAWHGHPLKLGYAEDELS